jgi:hypothetical protein
MLSSDRFWQCQSEAGMVPRHRAIATGADDLMANDYRPPTTFVWDGMSLTESPRRANYATRKGA